MPSATATHLHPTDLAGQQAEDAQYYREVLHELIDTGMELVRTVRQQAAAQAGFEGVAGELAVLPMHDAAVAFDRISRAVRRTVALARKVAELVPAKAEAGSGQKRAAARRRFLRDVQDAIQREAEGADVETLEAELRERLDGLSWTTRSATGRWRRSSPTSAAISGWGRCSATIRGSGARRRT